MAHDFESLVISLFGSVLSVNREEAREQIAEAIYKLGNKAPSTLLSAAHAYLLQNPKLTISNRAFVLRTISKVFQRPNAIELLDEQRALLIINLTTQEMTGLSKGADEECANAAREVLVTLCKHDRFVGDVMDALLLKFPPSLSTPPNRCIILSIAAVAQRNPFAFIPFLTDVLSRTIPVLSHLKHESAKSAWARAIVLFCEALVEFSSQNNQPKEEEAAANGQEAALIDEALQQNYADQLEAAYDVIAGWSYAKDPKCRADVAECIGTLCLIIPKTKIIRDLKKIVTNFLSLCKKTTELEELQNVIRGLANFLEATCNDETVPVDAYIDDIFNSLFVHICSSSDQTVTAGDQSTVAPNPLVIKVRNEAFRCFNVAAKQRFADKLVYWCLHKLQSEKDSVKLGATNLIRHLLNSSGAQMEDKRSLITMGLKPLLLDEQASVKVKMSICQLCVALADHGYVHAEGGGENVVQFLMTNLVPVEEQTGAAAGSTTRPDAQSMSQFYSQCAQALLTIAKTCDSASTLLWPYLFEFVCSERYTPALAEICKCCTTLARRKRENEADLFADLQTGNNAKVAGPHQVFARLFVCLNGAPLSSQLQRRGRECILLLIELSPWFHSALASDLPKRLERLLELLDADFASSEGQKEVKSGQFGYQLVAQKCAKTQKWQIAVLDVLDAVLQAVKDGEWREALAAALAQQSRLYAAYPQDKAFGMRLLGFCLARIANTTFVIEHFNMAVRNTNHGNQTERMGCALMMGHCGQVHTDLVLTELENIAKWEHKKASGGFLSRVAGYAYTKNPDADIVNLRATIVLSYGYFVLYCSTDVVTQHLNKVVLTFLRQYLGGFKADSTVKEAHLDTINLIAAAVHPSHLNSDYTFESRYEMFTYLKQYVKAEPVESVSNWVRLLACKATASLATLDPPLSDNELWDVGNVLTQSVFPMCREKGGQKALGSDLSSAFDLFYSPLSTASYSLQRSDSGVRSGSPALKSALKAEVFDSFTMSLDDDECSTMMDSTVAQYRNAIGQIILKKPTVQTLSQLLKMFQPFFGSSADHERIRAIESTVLILQVYLEHAADTKLGHANDFPPLCSILGRLAPRLSDSVAAVRCNSIRAIWYAFRLSLIHGGYSPNEHDILDGALFDLNDFIRTYLGSEGRLESQRCRTAISAIAKEIDSRLPQSQIQTYVSVLFKMLGDQQNQVSGAAAQLMTIMLESRGHLLTNEAEILNATILEHLPKVHPIANTYADLLIAYRILAAHHQVVCVDILLNQKLPYKTETIEAWMVISADRNQFQSILDYLLELSGVPADSKPSSADGNREEAGGPSGVEFFTTVDTGAGDSIKLVSGRLCALLAAFQELFKGGNSLEVLRARVPNILAFLFTALSAVIDAQYPTIGKESVSKKTPITAELCRLSSSPANLVVQTIQLLIERLQLETVIEAMNGERAWTNLALEQHYQTACTLLCRSVCECCPDVCSQLMLLMAAKLLTKAADHDRIAAALVLSALATRCPNDHGDFDLNVLKTTFEAIKTASGDKNLAVKKLALRAYSHVSALFEICTSTEAGAALFHELASTAVTASVEGLDDTSDRHDLLAIEAVITLESLVAVLKREVLESILAKLLLKIRPCFEKASISSENPTLRAVAFSLYGKLSLRVGQLEAFRESLRTNIVPILLYLNDRFDEVKKACSDALRNLQGSFAAPQLVTLLQNSISQSGLHGTYVEFLDAFCLVLTACHPDDANLKVLHTCNYFKSQIPRIRENAAHMVGFLLGHLSAEMRTTISTDLVFSGFHTLLIDADYDVRAAAADALSCLTNY